MKRILIIHPEGNLYQNPLLTSMVTAWSNKHSIDYECVFSRPVAQNINIIKRNKLIFQIKHKLICYFPNLIFLFRYIFQLKSRRLWDRVISVDREGAIEAFQISQVNKLEHIHISFEIMFLAETSKSFKNSEVLALKDVDKIIIQDETRAKLFCTENTIDINRTQLVPIAYPSLQASPGYRIRDEVGIPIENSVILWQGSLRKWNGVEQLKKLIEYLPENYSVLIHGRDAIELEHFKNFNDSENIFISNKKFENVLDMSALFEGVTWGIVFYEVQKNNRFLGRNIAEIGLASGKFGNFMRHGIPVIYNQCGPYLTKEIEENKLGVSFEEFNSILTIEKSISNNSYRRNCLDYFEDKINYERYLGALE